MKSILIGFALSIFIQTESWATVLLRAEYAVSFNTASEFFVEAENIEAGDPVIFELLYDNTETPVTFFPGAEAIYQISNQVRLTIGDQEWTSTSYELHLINYPVPNPGLDPPVLTPLDMILFSATLSPDPAFGSTALDIDFALQSQDPTDLSLINDVTLPMSDADIDLSGMTGGDFSISPESGAQPRWFISGGPDIVSLTITTIPEPSSVSLFLLAVISCISLRRRF